MGDLTAAGGVFFGVLIWHWIPCVRADSGVRPSELLLLGNSFTTWLVSGHVVARRYSGHMLDGAMAGVSESRIGQQSCRGFVTMGVGAMEFYQQWLLSGFSAWARG